MSTRATESALSRPVRADRPFRRAGLRRVVGVSVRKAQGGPPPSAQLELLGTSVLLAPWYVEATLPAHRREQLSAALRQILLDDTPRPADAAKWRGRLGVAQSLMFGRMGSALLQPFSARQYDPVSSPRWGLSGDLKEVIPRRIACLSNTIPRMVYAASLPPVLAYADASGQGHIACVIFADGVRTMAHARHPDRLRILLPGSPELEICANISGLALASELAPGRSVYLLRDNMGAMRTATRGACRAKLGRTIVSISWAMAAAYSMHVWVEYVASKLNCSDAPSLFCLRRPDGLSAGVSETNGDVPRLRMNIFPPKRELYKAQFQCISSPRCRASPWPWLPQGVCTTHPDHGVDSNPSPQWNFMRLEPRTFSHFSVSIVLMPFLLSPYGS